MYLTLKNQAFLFLVLAHVGAVFNCLLWIECFLPDSRAGLYLLISPSVLQFFSVQIQIIPEPAPGNGPLLVLVQHSISGSLPLLYCLHTVVFSSFKI